MRLLHIVPSYLPAWQHGGPIRAVHGLCSALAARGHEVTVFTTDTDLRGRVPIGSRVDRDGVGVWYFSVRGPRRLYWAPQIRSALQSHLGSFDLLHLHSVFLWPTSAAAGMARRAGVPYVVAPRGMLVSDLLRRRGLVRKTLWIKFVESETLANAAAIHATSELEATEARQLASDMALALPQIVVIPNGVDREDDDLDAPLSASVTAALARQPLVLFLGRLSWKKGLDRLIGALPHAPKATLAIAGGDEEGIGPRLRELAERGGVTDRVIFLGAVEGPDRVALLHRSALCVLPSYSENFGNAALEAMAAGTPVVVTREVGLAAEVQQSGAGIVVDGDPSKLGAALRALLEDDERRQAMGHRGRELVSARYRWESVAIATEAAYRQILRPGLGELDSRLREAGV